MATSLVQHVCRTRVSSVLNRDVKQFGKQFLFDNQDETCWNSDQGCPQYIYLEFTTAIQVSEISIQFQGGFAGKECWLECKEESSVEGPLKKFTDFYPDDINSVQIFELPSMSPATSLLKIVFNTSTDLFGRIIIYKMDILGQTT